MAAVVDIQEQVGDHSLQLVDQYVHLLGQDTHSGQSPWAFATAGITDTGSGVGRTYERWIRLRFTPPFDTVTGVRFWVQGLDSPPPGWSVRYGTTATFTAPVSSASSIAVLALPTSDPGRTSPNLLADTFAGTDTRYTDWVVIQASVDMSVAPPGPLLGFGPEGGLRALGLNFAWTET